MSLTNSAQPYWATTTFRTHACLHDGMYMIFFPSFWRWMSLKANPHIFLISGNKQKDTWTIML